ncbi:MAG: amino acid adenylation domain-containing protein [Candidatus Aminicenantes bacterium]|jgi:amino acid adenylation domain-containing protein
MKKVKKELLITLEEFEDAGKYWADKLSGQLKEPRLPYDYPPTQNYSQDTYPVAFAREIAEKIVKISKNNDLSLYIILLTSFKLLLFKYLDQDDIVVASPIYNSNNQDYNKYIVFRDLIRSTMTCKDLLMAVRETVVEGYKNEHYPLQDLFKSPALKDNKHVSLGRFILLLENIHRKEFIIDIRKEYENDIAILARRNGDTLAADLIYNGNLFKKDSMERFINSYFYILHQELSDTGKVIRDIALMTEAEKNKILWEFNNTESDSPIDKTVHEGFESQVEKTPDNIAASALIDMSEIHEYLESDRVNPHLLNKLKTCCFKKSPYIYECDIEIPGSSGGYKLLKTHRHNSVIVNRNVLELLEDLKGKSNLYSIFSGIEKLKLEFLIFSLRSVDVLEIVSEFKSKKELGFEGKFEDLLQVVKALYRNQLVEVVGVNSFDFGPGNPTPGYCEQKTSLKDKYLLNNLLNRKEDLSNAQVLLLGDTPGMPTTGLLYLSSFLKRNGIDVYCLFYDLSLDYASLRKNIEELLRAVRPRVVGVSLKWFAYMARVLEICKIVKEYAAAWCPEDIQVVVGGNTAAYYSQEIIRSEYVDFVIRGDGEIPLLNICRGDAHLPNCVYKKDGKIVENPITYVQNKTNASDIYLFHLDDILLSRYSSLLGTFFIFTHKGCPMDCFYCAGCRQTQENLFNRVVYDRDPVIVRKDILEARKYASTFMFDFVSFNNDGLLNYCKKMWQGIDLSSHFCIFANVIPPSPRLIALLNQTFKYVYWDLDIASLSERHRKELELAGVVKQQPSDEQVLAFFSECETYDNNEVRINLINGLPFVRPEDVAAGEQWLSRIISTYSCFSNLHWARLHAQPGAPIVKNPETYDMYSYASTYQDFLNISEKNFSSHGKLDFSSMEYPYIYFKNDNLNALLSKHYIETHMKVEDYRKTRRKKRLMDEDLSYRQLNQRANRVAAALREKAVRVDDIVGLMMDSSLEMVVAILGILKSGGAYLPIDHQWPLNWKKYLLENCGLKLLLTRQHLADDESLKSLPRANRLCIDKDIVHSTGIIDPYPDHDPNNLVYVIHTSGTTGKPRGVLINHKGLVNYTNWRLKTYRLTEDDVTLQPLSYSFDGFGSNFYSSLLSGGRLIMIPDSRRGDPDYIKEITRTYGVTNTSLVPGLYELILDYSEPVDLQRLRFVVLAGERSSEALIRKSREKVPHVRLFNEYGPTEASVTAVGQPDIDEFTTAVIGKRIANTRIYILNSYLEPTPVGIPGELCISGPGLARGYLNSPELTAEKFVEHMSYMSNRSYFYKTGDLARWLSDGTIEFLGRTDLQLKIRGFRVEPGEIETQLLKHNKIKAAVIIASENKDSENQQSLYAYIVVDSPDPGPGSGKELDTLVLKKYLSAHLPDYMIPSYFLPVNEIPLTSNGKIDRNALAKIELKTHDQYVPPETELEKMIADAWKEVLNLEKVGIDSNFFDLGGNSLKMITVNKKLKAKLGIEVPVMVTFEHTTIRSLSDYLRNEKTGTPWEDKEIKQADKRRDEAANMMEETLQIIGAEKND